MKKAIVFLFVGYCLGGCTAMLDTYKESMEITEPRHEQMGISSCVTELYKETRKQSDNVELLDLLTLCSHIYKGSADSQRILMERLVNSESVKKITLPTKERKK